MMMSRILAMVSCVVTVTDLQWGSSSRLSLPCLNSAFHFFTMLYKGAFSPSVTTMSSWISLRCNSVVRAFAHGAMGLWIDPSWSYFSFQPVLHDWCNNGCGMCNPVCGMVHIKEPLLLIGKSSLCGSSGFPFSLSECSLTICLTPYNRK